MLRALFYSRNCLLKIYPPPPPVHYPLYSSFKKYYTMANTSRNVAELEIEDIEGIGPTTARKMKEAGISSVMELATAVSEELATDLGRSEERRVGKECRGGWGEERENE